MSNERIADWIESIVWWSDHLDVRSTRELAHVVAELRGETRRYSRLPNRCRSCGNRHYRADGCPPSAEART